MSAFLGLENGQHGQYCINGVHRAETWKIFTTILSETLSQDTGVVSSIGAHPARQYLQHGVPISLATDNRLISGVTLTDEYRHARDALGMTREELISVARTGFEHAFVGDDVRSEMLTRFDEEVLT